MFKLLVLALALIFLNGCAGVDFYSNKELSEKTGLRYYTAKPYLLVARTGAPDSPVEVSTVYLPDLTKPQYAIHRRGFGKNKFAFKMTNSILTEVGIETEQGLSDIVGAITSGFKAIRETKVKGTPPEGSTFELYEIDMNKRELTRLVVLP